MRNEIQEGSSTGTLRTYLGMAKLDIFTESRTAVMLRTAYPHQMCSILLGFKMDGCGFGALAPISCPSPWEWALGVGTSVLCVPVSVCSGHSGLWQPCSLSRRWLEVSFWKGLRGPCVF